ncbi:hypothetical protein [Methanolapillus millepedarum]|uniref:Uncharacterized protein n=1 Tax=Methanolapillus millepedarum TaxID=3028296 RepID=A0AA96V3S5_9EURY|nr:hypothetical protein MsAc7_09250 [Methanosarcinaceae archaeon Ac7]
MSDYTIYKEENLTVETKNEIFQVMTQSFMKNPLIGGYFFRQNEKKVYAFIKTTVEYYMRLGDIIVCKNEDGKIVAVCVLGMPDTEPLSLGSVIKNGMLLDFIGLIFKVGPSDMKRTLKAAHILEINHIHEPHCYIYMISSVEKGAGRALLNQVIDTYTQNNVIYFESTVAKNNHEYYKSFGAKPVGETTVGGVSHMFFIFEKKGNEKKSANFLKFCFLFFYFFAHCVVVLLISYKNQYVLSVKTNSNNKKTKTQAA